jgi:hypothetical protein
MDDLYEKASRDRAKNRISRLKSFYTHVLIYITVNVLTFACKVIGFGLHPDAWDNCLKGTLTLGMLGLLAHAGTVYGPGLLNKKGWEERKMKELVEKEKQRTITKNKHHGKFI